MRGDAEVAERLVREFGSRLSDQNAATVARGVTAAEPGRRLLAVVNAAIDLCHGADTVCGLALAGGLVTFLERSWRVLEVDIGAAVRTYCAHAVNSYAFVRFQEGAWDECLQSVAATEASFPFIADHALYWNAVAITVRVLVNRNHASEARRELEAIPAGMTDEAPQIDLAARALREFETRRFDVDRRPTIGQQAQTIWDATLAEQWDAVRKMRESYLAQGLSEARRREVDRIVEVAETMHGIAAQDLPFEKKLSALAPMTAQWHHDLSRFLHPNVDWEHVNHAWVERRMQTTALLLAAENIDAAAMDTLLADLGAADAWAQRACDVHGRWQIAWNRILVLEKRAPAEVRPALAALYDQLATARRTVPDDETRSNIANYHPGFAAKICRCFDRTRDLDLLVDGCELRKGRALLAARADMAPANHLAGAGAGARSEALGPHTHYIGYTAVHGDDRIQAVLYTADGVVTSERIDVRVSAVRRRASQRQLDPSGWGTSSGTAPPLRAELGPLVAPLGEALRLGRIAPGDHVCVAADDPVHLVPLQYLFVCDVPAITLLSMSRCASFSDAHAISAVPALKPTAGTAVFVPAISKSLPQERREFDSVATAIASALGTCARFDDGPLTAPQLLAVFAPYRVIHVDAHGTFSDGGDPYRASGLVVSDGRGVPARGSASVRLLAPVHVIEGVPDLTGSHVTLSACVSGRGLEGKGGDVLGLEQSLRLRGAASVLASHWDVPSSLAGTFMRGFYGRWLGGGVGRACAWRDTVRAMMAAEATVDGAAECCVFSLFGDWR